jgi:hypothetical protein
LVGTLANAAKVATPSSGFPLRASYLRTMPCSKRISGNEPFLELTSIIEQSGIASHRINGYSAYDEGFAFNALWKSG